MAQEWAKKFYKSKAWKKARQAHIAKARGLCERCGRPGHIVHHKTYLTASNIADTAVSLGADNLEYLCLDCHNEEHMGGAVTADGLKFDEFGNLISIPPVCKPENDLF